MARIFISYSRKDETFARQLAADLDRLGGDVVWIDIEDIPAGIKWSQAIQQGLDACDVMILVITPESMASNNVEDEWQYYLDNKKPLIPVLWKPAQVQFQLSRIQYIDFHTQSYDTAFAQLHSELRRQGIPLAPLTLRDSSVQIPAQKPLPVQQVGLARRYWTIGAALAAVVGVALLLVLLNAIGGNGDNEDTPTPTTTSAEVGIAGTATETPGESPQPTDLPSNTPAPTGTPTPTETPLNIAYIAQTLDAQATIEQATLNVQATAAARATEYAVGTQNSIDQTATATLWTPTPTPNITASIDAYRTQQAATITQAWIESWTDTPTATLTPTDTLTPTQTPTHTPSLTPDPLEAVLDLAANFSGTRNADWEPFIQEFGGVEMVLVPAGCFEMGSTDEEIAAQVTASGDDWSEDQGPQHEVCFEEPFWIDRYEVTNGQFAQFNGEAANESYFSGDNRPREYITWEEASAYCASRDARLPTEAEWEYAAAGVESWAYPWGNTWEQARVIGFRDSSQGTAEVGSKPAGTSWVGAVDLSGNVWEWVADWYSADYYGTLADGAVNPSGPTSGTYRVLRGGAWDDTIADYFRASYRGWRDPNLRGDFRGFRCARSF